MGSAVVAVFGSSTVTPDEAEYREAMELGRGLASRGLTVATGGYSGIMEAVSRTAREEGADVIGVTAPLLFPQRSGPNPYVTRERQVTTLTERLHELVDSTDAHVFLAASLGTMAELMLAWNLAHLAALRGEQPKPIIAVGASWSHLVPLLAEALQADDTLVSCVEDVAGALELVSQTLP